MKKLLYIITFKKINKNNNFSNTRYYKIIFKGAEIMDKMTKGIIGGTIISAVGIYMLNDKKLRNQMAKNSKKMIKKTNSLINKIDF